jgi:glycosyltransferase involved in cell wall biosynthesis
MTREHNEFFLQTARAMPPADNGGRPIIFVLVGGNPEVLAWTSTRLRELGIEDRVVLPGFVAPAEVSAYQSAADVLVHHMPESMEFYRYCTPAKAFEYQASGRPIVATDIPLFAEVFGGEGERAIRATSRTPEALAAGVLHALELPDGGAGMAKRASDWVRSRTWTSRTRAILDAARRQCPES